MLSFLRHIWLSPVTLFGLVCAIGARFVRREGGVLLFQATGGIARLGLDLVKADGSTIGAVVFARRESQLAPGASLLEHELEHVQQGLAWGPLFPIAYVAAGTWQALRGRRWYMDNPFEVAARAAADRARAPR